MIKDIEINPQFAKALELMEEGSGNVFVTGRAGTGKSTLLEYFRSITSKNIVVLAPTGVAAVNISGQTIHSFFGFRPDVTVEKVRRQAKRKTAPIYKKLDAIVIDEISMVRADLLDCIDEFLRINGKEPGLPFGGIQMIFIGDLYQIPPVVTADECFIFDEYYDSEYFFDSRVYAEIEIEHVELEKIYRQSDPNFIALLNKIRNKTIAEEDIGLINWNYIVDSTVLPKDTIYLTTTNAMAEERNKEELLKLPGKPDVFEADISGDIDRKHFPAEELLVLKKGAQVMLLNNDSAGRWINGTLGTVVGIEEDCLEVRLSNGPVEEVKPFKWNVYRFYWDQDSKSVAADNVGSFRQFPLKLAWAITIHKSQGKTFDNVAIDLGRGTFASGQLYVALSRCRSLEGVFLKREINLSDVRVDFRVMKFLTGRQYELSEERLPLDYKVDILRDAVEQNRELEIVYLKNTDEKSKRLIKPESVGMMEYSGRGFLGIRAYCYTRNEMRTFRVDRILEIKDGDKVYEIEGFGTERESSAGLTGIAGCIDVETTGLSPSSDQIIELALVLFSYDRQGITGIVDSYCGMREPDCEISSGAYGVHGLTMENLVGRRLDIGLVRSMIEKADFLVAHNASFDKGFVAPMFPVARKKRWYCSMSGIRWRGSRSLQRLLDAHDIEPDQRHRALADVEGLLCLLSEENSRGETYFAEMYGRRPLG